MKNCIAVFSCMLYPLILSAQAVQERIDKAMKNFQSDPRMKHALASLYVVETKTGKPVYALNEETGMAPASTQKIFTSIASFELLGKDYRYQTTVSYEGKIVADTLKGNLVIKGSGDPTLGSWRYASTKPEIVASSLEVVLRQLHIRYITGNLIMDNSLFAYQPLPGGWVWDDIGNYYGAGAWALNWNENQYDLITAPGNKAGDEVKIVRLKPPLYDFDLLNFLKTGKAGSGDNGYIYAAPYAHTGFVTGTVPAGGSEFALSGAIPDPPYQLGKTFEKWLKDNKVVLKGEVAVRNEGSASSQTLMTISSPAVDSIIYWFLQKSINLYGESLLKTIAAQETGIGSTEKGVEQLKLFWQHNGIDSAALNILDGSGLSPQNRVTTHALVTALQLAKGKGWYTPFYSALPLYNGIKMKSGTIGGTKAFAGYHTSKDGGQYTFAIIVNNFDNANSSVVPLIYKVLDELK